MSNSLPINQKRTALLERIKPVWEMMSAKLRGRQPEPKIECPHFDADEDDDPLFDTTRGYVEQVDRYKGYQGKPITRKVRAAPNVRPAPALAATAPAAPPLTPAAAPAHPPARSGKFTRG